MKSFSLLSKFILPISIFSLIGCVQPTPHDPDKNLKREENAASFYITKIEKDGPVAKTNIVKGWDIPQAKKYALSTCIRENITNNKLPGHPFVIKVGDVSTRAETDADGCLSWTQYIPYNFLADSQHVFLKGYIQSTGTLKGQRPFKIAFNPWTQDRGSKTPEFVDLRDDPNKPSAIPEGSLVMEKGAVNNALKGLSKQGKLKTRFIWAPKLSYTGVELGRSKNGVSTELQLSIKPSIALTDIYGASYAYKLKKGSFDVWAQVIAVTIENGKYVRTPLTRSVPKKKAVIVNGQLDVNLLTTLQYQAHDGFLELALRLVPRNAPPGLTRLEGIYRMGKTKDIFKTQTGLLQKNMHNVGQKFSLQKKYIPFLFKVNEKSAGDLPDNIYSLTTPVSFFVHKLSGSSIRTKVDKKWRFTQARDYTVTACLKSNLNNSIVKPGQTFFIRIGKEHRKANTGDDGCVSWKESFAYDSISQAANILIQRKITGVKRHYGTRNIKFIINPWNKDHKINSPEFIEQTTSKAPKIPKKLLVSEEEALSYLMGTRTENYGYLHLPSVHTRISQTHKSNKGLNIRINLTLQPKIILFDHFGNPLDPKVLTSGEFKLIPYIVSVRYGKDKKEIRQILSKIKDPKQTHVSIKNSQLIAGIDVDIPGLYKTGDLELALRLVPINNQNHIKRFEGVFDLGSAHKITPGTIFPKNDFLKKNFSFQRDYLDKIPNIADIKGAPSASAFDLETLIIKFKGIRWQTATKRMVDFSVETRVFDGFHGHYIEKEDFTIRMKGEPDDADFPSSDVSTTKESLGKGYLAWTGTIQHKYYSPERYIKKRFILEHKSGFKREFSFYINPWTRGWEFGQDKRINSEERLREMEKRSENALPARLIIANYNLETFDFFTYSVDNFLSLEFHKPFQLQIRPYVIRDTLINGANTSEPLKDGVYLLRVAAKKSYFGVDGQVRDFISPIQKLVTVRNGLIITPIVFTVRDMRLIRLRTFLLIQLETIDLDKVNMIGENLNPHERVSKNFSIEDLKKYTKYNYNALLDKDSGLKTRTFMGPLVMLSNYSSAAMRPTDDLSSSVCETPDCNQLASLQFSSTKAVQMPVKRLYSLDDKSLAEIDDSFKDMTVEKLISRWLRMEKQYLKSMTRQSSFNHFIKNNNLEVIQLSEEPSPESFTKDFTPEIQRENNKVFIDNNGLDGLIKELNRSPLTRDNYGTKPNAKVTQEDINRLFEKGTMSPILVIKMCQLFFKKIINYPNSKGVRLFDVHDNDLLMRSQHLKGEETSFSSSLIKHCGVNLLEGLDNHIVDWDNLLHKKFSRDTPLTKEHIPFPFIIDRKLKVHKTSKVIESAGLALNFNVNTRTSEDAGDSKSNSVAAYFSPLKWIKGVFSQLLSGIGFSASTVRSNYKSRNSNAASGTGIYLSTEMKQILLGFQKYESCITIKLNPESITWDPGIIRRRSLEMKHLINNQYSEQEIFDHLTRGLMLCSGDVIEPSQDDPPKYFRETYYYTTQHFTEGNILDFSNLINHPWLLSVRGLSTFTNFIKQMDGTRVIWESSTRSWRKPNLDDQKDQYPLGFYPVERLALAYAGHLPSTPGFYTLLPGEVFDSENISMETEIDPESLLNQENKDDWKFNDWLEYLTSW